ncbi:MAG: PDZ domain-containing protein [Peptococcaceae bacterium]|nr:PDZ domain-containing protein [Peptococcaceae bacterium]
MFPFGWALKSVLETVLLTLLNPLFWLVVLLVFFQYRRVAGMRQKFFGLQGYGGIIRDLAVSVGFGLIGGLVGGYLIVLSGLTITESSVLYLLLLAVLLMLISPRFLCFAYGGGLLALSNLILGWPEINIPQILALVAILHFIESVLIFISGHTGAVPAFVKLPSGRVVGGFSLQRFWPIPTVIFLMWGNLPPGVQGVEMPQWWPVVPPPVSGNPGDLVYVLMPVVAALGYTDLSITRPPAAKTRVSSFHLAGYSIVLFVLAVMAGTQNVFAWLAALFSPLGHEFLIRISKRAELARRPVYVPDPSGLKVLDVLEGSPAWNAGVRSGDVLCEINGRKLFSRSDLFALLAEPGHKEIGFLRQGRHYARESVVVPPGDVLGILPVPEGTETQYLTLTSRGFLSRWLKRRH